MDNKALIDNVKSYCSELEELTRFANENYQMAVLTFDFEFMRAIKSTVETAVEDLSKYLKDQEEAYKSSTIMLKLLGREDPELLTLLWDLKRPVMYRLQDLNNLLESINFALQA